MSTPTPRPTRSRYSSPFPPVTPAPTHENANGIMAGSERRSNAGEGWKEPPLPAPRPSFADAGIERHGVVQNMAPLGQRPSLKVLKLAQKPNLDVLGHTARKSGPSSASTPGESVVTPEPQSQPPRERSESMSKSNGVEEVLESVAEAPVEAEEDVPVLAKPEQDIVLQVEAEVEELPKSSPKTPQPTSPYTTSRPSIPPQSAGQSVFPVESPVAVANIAPPPPPPTLTPMFYHPPIPQPTQPALGPDGLPLINHDFTDRVVESAVQDALDALRWPTAYALRTLYDDNRTDINYVRLIEAIYWGWATKEQHTEFAERLRKRKREGKKGRTGEYYFNGDGSDPAPMRPLASLIHTLQPPPTKAYQTPYTAIPPRPSSGTPDFGMRSSSMNMSSAPFSTPQRDQDHHAHVDKRQRTNSFQPTNGEVSSSGKSGDKTADGDASADGNGVTKDTTPTPVSSVPLPNSHPPPSSANGIPHRTPKKMRSGSLSSSSSLSSVDETLLAAGAFSPPGGISRPVSGLSGSALASLGFLGATSRPKGFVSPYASASNFAAAASASASEKNPVTVTGTGTGTGNQAVAVPPITTQASEQPKQCASTSTSTPISTASPSSPVNINAPAQNTLDEDNTNTKIGIDNTTTITTTSTDPGTAAATMAPVATDDLTPPPSFSSSYIPSDLPEPQGKAAKKAAELRQLDPEEPRTRMKRKAKSITTSAEVSESFERHRVQTQDVESASDVGEVVAIPQIVAPPPVKRQKLRLLNNRGRNTRQSSNVQNDNDDSDQLSSPTVLDFRPDLAPGSVNSSRAGTPATRTTGRKTKAAGSGLRVKTSPIKKKGGTSAGLTRENDRGAKSPTTNGPTGPMELPENNDFCTACGGGGELLCCDGCVRSFHFKCVDPPIGEGLEPMPDDWYCNSCQMSKFEPDRGTEYEVPGIFGKLVWNLDSRNPRSFQLPRAIRETFQDVLTGPDGEYEEPPKDKDKDKEKKDKKGYEEPPDYFRKKDIKGKPVLCHYCAEEASAPDRSIIQCGYCGLWWHLDCCPNPLAKEPTTSKPWRCPVHVEDLLAELPALLGPAHRWRRLREAAVVKPSISRGFKNNGFIEVELSPEEPEENSGFFIQREFGRVYKLSEESIRLDFLQKVRESKEERRKFRPEVPQNQIKNTPMPRLPGFKTWDQRSLEEQQAALNIAAVAVGVPTNSLITLIDALIDEASPTVLAMMAKGDASKISRGNLSKSEKRSLRFLSAMIEEKLNSCGNDDEPGEMDEVDEQPNNITTPSLIAQESPESEIAKVTTPEASEETSKGTTNGPIKETEDTEMIL